MLDGTVFRRLPDKEVIFQLVNRQVWDASLRDGFTAQLQGTEALATFGPYSPAEQVCSRDTMGEIIDAEAVLARLRPVVEGEGPDDPWLATCLERLRATLQGA